MNSPITENGQVSLVRTIPTWYIIDSYLNSYGIDVKRLLHGRNEVEVYRCHDSELEFYGPSEAAGDSRFYSELQQFPWYYMDWKWEHQVVFQSLNDNDELLEIGCAEGAFFKRLPDSIKSVGLELNQSAAANGKSYGFDIRTETIQEHALTNADKYDVVCSFQVMEHVTEVKSIIEASLKVLKPGGRLIISVPNNDSFIKHSPLSILNMPPHHMNLWNQNSLSRLSKFFEMDISSLTFEPLQEYHFNVVVNNFIERRFSAGTAGKIVKKLIKWTRLYYLVGLFKNRIKGHTIIAEYVKRR